MKLRNLGEEGFIKAIRRRFGRLAPAPPRGIGDDAAWIPRAPAGVLVSTDCLVEGIHFRRGEPARLLGRKSLAVNLSDIAAMGGRPSGFLLTLAVPPGLPPRFFDDFIDGLHEASRQHSTELLGGDCSASGSDLVVSITVFGTPAGKRARVLPRDGARPGDTLFVSGALGSSATGRLLLSRGWRLRLDPSGRDPSAVAPAGARPGRDERTRALEAMLAHLDPRPRVELGADLARLGAASAAIDVSDGLSIDLERLAASSRVGAVVMEAAVPIGDPARALAARLGTDPLALALAGGEDYQLLFTVPPSRRRLLTGLDALPIGRITRRTGGLRLVRPGGRERRLPKGGHDHFRLHGGLRAPGR